MNATKDREDAQAATAEAAMRLAELPDTLTVDEAGRVLRLGRNSMYEGIRRKEIPAIKIGRRLLVPKAGIERLLSGAGSAR